MQERSAGSRWMLAILCAGALLAAPVLAMAGTGGSASLGKPVSVDTLRGVGDSGKDPVPHTTPSYPRTVAWWPYTTGPFYGAVDSSHDRDDDVIWTNVGTFRVGQPLSIPTELMVAVQPAQIGRTTQYFLVQLRPSALETDFWGTLTSMGVSIVDQLPVNALIVRADQAALGLLQGSPLVQHLEPYQPAYKLLPSIGTMPQGSPEAAASPFFTLAIRTFAGESAADLAAAIRKLGGEVLSVYAGSDSFAGSVGVRVHATQIPAIARLEGVSAISETNPVKLHSTRGSLFMQSETAVPGDFPFWKAGIDGDGEVVHITDSGLSVDAGDHSDTRTVSGWNSDGACNVSTTAHRKMRCYRTAADYGGAGDLASCDSAGSGGGAHGQLTSGLVAGNGTRDAVPASTAPSPSGTYGAGWYLDNDHDGQFTEIGDTAFDGIAKGAKIVFIDASSGCPDGGISAGNLQNNIVGTWNSYRAAGHNFSFGSDASTVTGPAYGGGADQIDAGILASPINFVAVSAGNAGTDEGQSGAVGNIGNEASCKNCVAVGASNAYTTLWTFSSHGPAQNAPGNKRVAPLLMAEGVDDACRAEEGTGNPENQTGSAACFLQQSSGTSFSSPNVVGAATIVRDYFNKGFYPDGTDQNSTNSADIVNAISSRLIKALMVAGSRPLTAVGGPFTATRFNNVWGYGRVSLVSVLPLANFPQTPPGLIVCDDPGDIDGNAGNDGVCNLSGMGTISTTVGETNTSEFQVLDAKTDLAVAVVWDDATGANLVNDLDLEVWWCGANQTCSATATPDADDRVWQGNNFSEDYDRDGTTFDDLDADSSIDGYYYSITTKRITDAGKVPANWRDTANNVEAVFVPVFNNAPDRNANGQPDIDPLSDDALGNLNPKTGKWQIRVIRRSGTTNNLKYAAAIAGPVSAGSSVRFDTNPVTCNGDLGVIVAEVNDGADVSCPNPGGCLASTIASRTVVESVNPSNTVVDSISGLTFSQSFSGATALFRYESGQIPLTSVGTASNADTWLNVQNGYTVRATYTDQPGAKARVASATVDCSADLVLIRSFILGPDAFLDLSDGCDGDQYLDAGESFSLSIDYYNADSTELIDGVLSVKAVVPDGDDATDPCRNNNPAATDLTVLNGTRDIGIIPSLVANTTTFSLRVNGTPGARTRRDLVFSIAGAKVGQAVQACYGVEVLLQADDETHQFLTDCPTGCTLDYDRNDDERNDNRIARNPFDVFDIARRGLDETAISFENLTVNNTSGWPSPCTSCGNSGFAGVWDFDTNDEGFRSGISPQSKLTATTAQITNWGEDRNWNNVLDAGEDANSNGTLQQNWGLGGGCGFMTASGTNRGIWHTGTIGTYATADDTTACRPNDTKCEQYDQMAGTLAVEYWFETLRTPVIHPTRFGTDPDGFQWRTQILDWSWNGQLDFPAQDGNALMHADLDLDLADNNIILGDDLVQVGGFGIGNSLGLVGGGQNNIYGGAFAFAGTNQKNEANYGDNKVTARGGNRAGRRGCYFNDLNLIADGQKTAAERPVNLPKPSDDDCDNDYSLGANGCPGNCGVDDDGNGIVDDFREICPCKRCNGGPRNLAACITVADCNPDGGLTNGCADATGATKATAFTSPDGVAVGEGDDTCGAVASIDEGVQAAFGTGATVRQIRNTRIDGDANGVGGVGTPVGNIRFNTLEDFYGEFVGNSWQGEVGMVVFEGSGNQAKQSYGLGIDDMVIEWQEVKPVAQAGTACTSPAYDGQCARLTMASEFDTFDGDVEVAVTVVDPIPTGNLNDCNVSGTPGIVVEAWSEVEGTPEAFCLLETGAGTNTFTGKIKGTTRIAKSGDGLVYLARNNADNPSISARYIDENDGVRAVSNGPDGQPGIAGFDDDGDSVVDDADELCPRTTTLAVGRSPHQPGSAARYSDDTCGCPDNPLVAVTLARFDSVNVVVSDVVVRDTNVAGTGNGDNDGWADPGEVVNLDVVLKNFSNFPVQDVVLTVATDSANVACILDNEIRNVQIPERNVLTGVPGTVDTSLGTDHFAFKAQGSRAGVNDEFSSTWTLSLQGTAKGGPAFAIASDTRVFGTLALQTFKVVHNLSASAVGAATTTFDNFESYTTDSAMLNSWPRFNTGNDPAELEGTRCQTNDPSNPFGNNVDVNSYCELGEGFNNSENHWHLHANLANACDGDGTGCEGSGRSVSRPDSGCTGTCVKSMSSANTAEGDETAFIGDDLTMDVNRMTWVEMQNSVQLGNGAPELTYWTQMSLQDNRLAGLPRDWGITIGLAYICVDKNANNDCDTAETGLKNNTENWEPLRSYFNPEQAFRRNNFINCSYDPSDDGNNENQFFQNQLDVGPSSTCFPQSVNNCLGRTAVDRDTPFGTVFADVGTGCYPETNVLDDPNLSFLGSRGGGRWIQKKYNLEEWRGRRVLVRFHISPFGWPGIERWSQFSGIANEDDGWFIDDVRVTGTVASLTLAVDNVDKGGAACPATNCNTITAKAAVLSYPLNDKDGQPKPAKACTAQNTTDCDFDNDNTVDANVTTAPSAAAGHAFLLDGSASVADRCLGGTLEYKWAIQAGATVRDFLTDPQALVAPDADTTYVLTTRCSSAAATCTGSVNVSVDIPGGGCTLVVNSATFSNDNTINWTGGTGPWDVARGNCSEFTSPPTWATATCLANNTSGTSLSVAPNPPAGQSFYYLVRCDGGTYNDGTQTGTRSVTACP